MPSRDDGAAAPPVEMAQQVVDSELSVYWRPTLSAYQCGKILNIIEFLQMLAKCLSFFWSWPVQTEERKKKERTKKEKEYKTAQTQFNGGCVCAEYRQCWLVAAWVMAAQPAPESSLEVFLFFSRRPITTFVVYSWNITKWKLLHNHWHPNLICCVPLKPKWNFRFVAYHWSANEICCVWVEFF